MNKEFVPYDIALQLKELGFNEDCLAYYNTAVSSKDLETTDWWGKKENDFSYALIAPLYQQAFRWFRERYGLYSYIEPVLVEAAKSPIKYDYVILEKDSDSENYNNLPYHTYTEAEDACIRKLIEIVKNGKG